MPHDPKKAEELAKEIGQLITEKLGYRPSFVLVYSEPDYQQMHWITNVARKDGIGIARAAADQMQAEIN